MKMKAAVVVVLFIALAAASIVLTAQRQSAAGHQPSVAIIGPPPPLSSLQQLWDRTPVVVLATVQNTLPPHLERGQIVVRFQMFDVNAVLKDKDLLVTGKQRLRVKQYGGTTVVDGREFRTTFIADPLPDGTQAILFLTPLDGGATFEVLYGATGTFPVDKNANTIRIHQTARRLPEFGGRGEVAKDELIALLRHLASSGQS
jgi:hypothetical protein